MLKHYKGTISLICEDYSTNLDNSKKLSLVPESAIQGLQKKQNHVTHVTVLNSNECNIVEYELWKQKLESINEAKIYHLGLGNQKSVWYEIVGSPELQRLRIQIFNLPWKDFHITLGLEHSIDNHAISKGPNTLLMTQDFSITQGQLILECLTDHWNTLRDIKQANKDLVQFSLDLAKYAIAQLTKLCEASTDSYSLLILLQKLCSHQSLIFYFAGNYPQSYTSAKMAIEFYTAEMNEMITPCATIEESMSIAYCRLADAAFKLDNRDMALVSYWKAHLYTTDEKLSKYTFNRLHKLWKLSICSIELRNEEAASITLTSSELLYVQTKRQQLILHRPDSEFEPLCIEPRHRCSIVGSEYQLPRNFSWVVPLVVAGMSTPKSAEDIVALAKLGIRTVITLTEEERLPANWFPSELHVTNIFWPVSNYFPPCAAHADKFIEMVVGVIHRKKGVQTAGSILVHCGGGKGRAGSLLASYLVRFGTKIPSKPCVLCQRSPALFCDDSQCAYGTVPQMTAQDAINQIRKWRPGSIETEKQENFIQQYSSLLYRRYGQQKRVVGILDDNDSSEDSNNCQLPGELNLVDGHSTPQPTLIILVGLPASGKSWFAKELMISSNNWRCISQDDAGGSRATFENELSQASSGWLSTVDSKTNKGNHHRLVVDRVNPTAAERKSLISMAGSPANTVIVHFDVALETCICRAQQRLNHPTLAPHSAPLVINSFAKILEVPSLLSKEHREVKAIYKIKTFADAELLLSHFGVTTTKKKEMDLKNKFYKFPRTRHLFNLGAATRDDLVISNDESLALLQMNHRITVEEKIDGANLGFRIDESTKQVVVQNRSHVVTSSSHVQFNKLDRYVNQHMESLFAIIGSGDLILYGEWLAAKHSISYDRLPDLFIAFDVFDIKEQKFYSRARFHELLSETDIAYVRPIADRPVGLLSKQTLVNLIHKQSNYSSDKCVLREGVVIRLDDDDNGVKGSSMWLADRVKIVRGDFIAGDEHWSKGMIQFNSVTPKDYSAECSTGSA